LLRVDVQPSVCPREEVGEEEDLDEEAAAEPLELEVVCELEQIDDNVWGGKRRVGENSIKSERNAHREIKQRRLEGRSKWKKVKVGEMDREKTKRRHVEWGAEGYTNTTRSMCGN
tara:strand:- start:576 stop:920 length:345 start_codon:yes stop_codon:yes gene_type:complete